MKSFLIVFTGFLDDSHPLVAISICTCLLVLLFQ